MQKVDSYTVLKALSLSQYKAAIRYSEILLLRLKGDLADGDSMKIEEAIVNLYLKCELAKAELAQR